MASVALSSLLTPSYPLLFNMKLPSDRLQVIVLACLVAAACADLYARIPSRRFQVNEDAAYKLRFETSNGIKSDENGVSRPGNSPESGNYVRSGVHGQERDGVAAWTADENGYYAEGDHLP